MVGTKCQALGARYVMAAEASTSPPDAIALLELLLETNILLFLRLHVKKVLLTEKEGF